MQNRRVNKERRKKKGHLLHKGEDLALVKKIQIKEKKGNKIVRASSIEI